MECLYCGQELDAVSVEKLPTRTRLAFDPLLGRLWQVCGSCERWNATPFESRWEVLEVCEQQSTKAAVLLQAEHLCLMQAGRTQLIRVGRPRRVEFSVWRYSELLDRFGQRRGRFSRILQLPERPVGGNIGRDYHGGVVTVPDSWIGSPFLEHGGLLTLLFSSIPFSPRCPSCDQALMLEPARFGHLRFVLDRGDVRVVVECALCRSMVALPIGDVRPALRTALAVVSRKDRSVDRVRRAVEPVDRRGGSQAFVHHVAYRDRALGSLSPRLRLALWLALDEMAEADSLESEWRRAEELASISDGELTLVPGFAEFKRIAGGHA